MWHLKRHPKEGGNRQGFLRRALPILGLGCSRTLWQDMCSRDHESGGNVSKMRSESCREGKDRTRPWEYVPKSGQRTHMTRNVFKGSLSLYGQNIRSQLRSQGLHVGSHSVVQARNDDSLGKDIRERGVEKWLGLDKECNWCCTVRGEAKGRNSRENEDRQGPCWAEEGSRQGCWVTGSLACVQGSSNAVSRKRERKPSPCRCLPCWAPAPQSVSQYFLFLRMN